MMEHLTKARAQMWFHNTIIKVGLKKYNERKASLRSS